MGEINSIIAAFCRPGNVAIRCPDHDAANIHWLALESNGAIRCCGGKCQCGSSWTSGVRNERMLFVRVKAA